jgi:hypothetical protein
MNWRKILLWGSIAVVAALVLVYFKNNSGAGGLSASTNSASANTSGVISAGAPTSNPNNFITIRRHAHWGRG